MPWGSVGMPSGGDPSGLPTSSGGGLDLAQLLPALIKLLSSGAGGGQSFAGALGATSAPGAPRTGAASSLPPELSGAGPQEPARSYTPARSVVSTMMKRPAASPFVSGPREGAERMPQVTGPIPSAMPQVAGPDVERGQFHPSEQPAGPEFQVSPAMEAATSGGTPNAEDTGDAAVWASALNNPDILKQAEGGKIGSAELLQLLRARMAQQGSAGMGQ